MNIPEGIVGRVINSNNELYVKIIDDSLNTGGFLIITSKNHDMSDGFDDWVQNKEGLFGYIREAGWIIDWT